MAEELTNETLLIKGLQEKESRKSGKPFWVVDTNKGEYTCFEPDIFTELGKNLLKNVDVKTFIGDEYKNIREFIGLAKDQDVKAEKVEPGQAKTYGAKVEMLVSYAKDILVAGKAKSMSEATMEVIEAYKTASKEL